MSTTEFPSTPEMGSFHYIGAVKAGDTPVKLVEEVNPITKKNPENIQVLRPITNKVVHAESVTESPSTTERDSSYVIRVVKAGDTLTKLVESIYGNTDQQLIMLVQQHNSRITNKDRILVGDTIIFPVVRKN